MERSSSARKAAAARDTVLFMFGSGGSEAHQWSWRETEGPVRKVPQNLHALRNPRVTQFGLRCERVRLRGAGTQTIKTKSRKRKINSELSESVWLC